MRVVALVLSLSGASGTAQWTAINESKEIQSDKQRSDATLSKLDALLNSSKETSAFLHGNGTVLKIMNEELDKLSGDNALADLQEQKQLVEKDKKDRQEAETALTRAIAKARSASAAEKQAEKALEAVEKDVAAKRADVQTAEAALQKANDYLVRLLSNPEKVGSPNVLAAHSEVDDKATKLKAAKDALGHAEGSRIAKATAHDKAEEMVRKRRVQQQKAQQAVNEAGYVLRGAADTLEKERIASAPKRLELQRLRESIEAQERVVESLESRNASLNLSVSATQHDYTELQEAIKHASSCKIALLDADDKVHDKERTYNLTFDAWQASPTSEGLRAAAWDDLVALVSAKYDRYLSTKGCAPSGLDIPPASPPAHCEPETPGTCSVLWCDRTRGAYCDLQTHRCRCPGGYCARGGGCQSRGPPTVASLDRERGAQGGAQEPPSGGWTFPVTLVAALLAALLAAAAAAAVAQKRRAGGRAWEDCAAAPYVYVPAGSVATPFVTDESRAVAFATQAVMQLAGPESSGMVEFASGPGAAPHSARGAMDSHERGEIPELLRAGCIGAAAACVVGTPLDVARHSAQAAVSKKSKQPAALGAALRAAAEPGAVRGLWRGLAPALAHAALAPGAFLLSYELLKGDKTPFEAALQARAVQVVALQPLEFLRTCRQGGALLEPGATEHLRRSAWQVAVQDGGPKTLWRGLGPTLARDVLFTGTFLAAYIGFERARRGVGDDRDAAPVPAMELAAFGSAAAVAAAVVTQPFDVAKTRMQTHKLVQSNDEGYLGGAQEGARRRGKASRDGNPPLGGLPLSGPLHAKVPPGCSWARCSSSRSTSRTTRPGPSG
ncbi:unnamed protein product [Prorocentrum cordatum]|uniref:Mitochondrial carrier protein n=1 Tax=Prorocentrum cordatum TaxID=2364126 RepID=A0ABN9T5F6_9DINO|nr:unnamed protein product [Polarella glacialis]